MQVEHVWVDTVSIGSGGATVQSTVYSFGDARWVSVHSGAEGDRLGPVTVVDADAYVETPTVKRLPFKPRALPIGETVSLRSSN